MQGDLETLRDRRHGIALGGDRHERGRSVRPITRDGLEESFRRFGERRDQCHGEPGCCLGHLFLSPTGKRGQPPTRRHAVILLCSGIPQHQAPRSRGPPRRKLPGKWHTPLGFLVPLCRARATAGSIRRRASPGTPGDSLAGPDRGHSRRVVLHAREQLSEHTLHLMQPRPRGCTAPLRYARRSSTEADGGRIFAPRTPSLHSGVSSDGLSSSSSARYSAAVTSWPASGSASCQASWSLIMLLIEASVLGCSSPRTRRRPSRALV